MSIASEITRLQTAKADLKTAIEGKGVTVPGTAKLDDYAGLVASISAGAEYAKGTFTVPNEGSRYTLNFGKTFSKYFFLLEVTDESMQSILNSGETAFRSFEVYGKYQKSTNAHTTYVRVNPSTSVTDATVASNIGCEESDLYFTPRIISYGANYIYQGLTYNYYIVEIK